MQNRMKLIHNDSLSCEPILRRMANGDLLCVCQCGGVTEPAPDNRVLCFLSHDNGYTWDKPFSIYPETGESVYLTEVNELDGAVNVYLEVHNGHFLNMKCVVMQSRDCGRTWINVGHPPFYPGFCFVRGTVKLTNGEILMPCQHFPVSQEENDRLLALEDASLGVYSANIDHLENNVVISADNGKTWQHFIGPKVAIKGSTGRNWAWTEPTIAETSDGTLVMLARIDGTGCLWRSESKDFGRTWTELVKTDIPNPGNKPKLIPLPEGKIALLHTPNSVCGMENRNPFAIWISDDGMKTWSDKRVLSDMPLYFCYPDGFYEDGHIYFTIELNRHEILFVDHTI